MGLAAVVLGGVLVAASLRWPWDRGEPDRATVPTSVGPTLHVAWWGRIVEGWIRLWYRPAESIRLYEIAESRFGTVVVRAGWPYGLTAGDWCLVGGLIGPVAAISAWYALPSPLFAAASGIVGAVGPLVWLHSESRHQRNKVFHEFPDYLDMASLSMAAGIDLATATEGYIRVVPNGILAKHLRILLVDMRAGSRLIDCWHRLEEALGIETLAGFFAATHESLRIGSGLGDTFAAQAHEIRNRRFLVAEARATTASVKLILPMMMIFLSVLLVVLGPLLVQFLGGIR